MISTPVLEKFLLTLLLAYRLQLDRVSAPATYPDRPRQQKALPTARTAGPQKPVGRGSFFVQSLLASDLSRSWRNYVQSFSYPLSHSGGTLLAPFCPPPRPVPRYDTHQGNYKRDDKRSRKMKKGICPSPAAAIKSGVGRNGGGSSPISSSAPAPCSSSHSRSSSSDTTLTAYSSSAGTRLPTSVDERKSSRAWLHLPSARRSRSFHQSFHLPVSFPTSAHRIFCCSFHFGHS